MEDDKRNGRRAARTERLRHCDGGQERIWGR